ncbi:sigma-54-dependent Fis family transcriptional regulator [Chondromyces apiculatus]|uniref:FHA domain-containing protein n=1 Tax=Chondromyces apiculatus DSM 436 TaxID=1192034 RepID=A0A017TJB1_9BACT|nr:sigma-54-dependent Fis family transcriptional regulator [Chondromyces apiculatus]EYF08711.1 Hypothetical protein CAP_2572 [Chondromyces apiculatus DSM 436]
MTGPGPVAGATQITEKLISGDLGPPDPEGTPRWILVLYHREGAVTVQLEAGKSIVIGREPPASVILPDASLSRKHARITLLADGVCIEDLGSTNGIQVDSRRIKCEVLSGSHEIRLGNVVGSLFLRRGTPLALPGIESHDVFHVALEQEIIRARHFGRPLALLMIRPLDAPAPHVSRWSMPLRELLRSVDRVGLYSADTLQVLLPEAGLERATELAELLSRRGDQESVHLGVAVAVFPESAPTAHRLLESCRDALQRTEARSPVCVVREEAWVPSHSTEQELGDAPIVGRATHGIFEMATRLASVTLPVLVLGETGVGKEVFARAVHERGPRRQRSLITLNCAAIPPQLVESTLFGHERGAFTGAGQQQRGVFEAANGGTLFLDEVGELPPAAQGALLRTLETSRVMRVGSTREIEVDVRIVAATNRNLEVMIREGTFRPDLFFRLNAMSVTLPPLRDRIDEIEPHVRRMLARGLRGTERKLSVSEPAWELLRRYPWPGNIRELRNVIERALVIAQGSEITEQDLPERIHSALSPATLRSSFPGPGTSLPPGVSLYPSAGSLVPLAGLIAHPPADLNAYLPPGSNSNPPPRSSSNPPPRSSSNPPPGSSSSPPPEVDPASLSPVAPPPSTEALPVRSVAGVRRIARETEARMILDALRETQGNQTEAARRIGMPLRTFVRKLGALRRKGKSRGER